MNRLFILFFFVSGITKAQTLPFQEALYTQYQGNFMATNPAFAGVLNNTNFTINIGQQILGMNQINQLNQVFSVDAPMSKKMGIGLQAYSNKLGGQSSSGAYVSSAYVLGDEDYNLRIGVQGGLTTTPQLLGTSGAGQNLQMSAGLGVLGQLGSTYIALSKPLLLSQKSAFMMYNPAFLQVGTQLFASNIEILPHLLVEYNGKKSGFNHNAVNVGVKAWLGEKVALTGTMRMRGENGFGQSQIKFLPMLEYQLSDNFRIGYMYDYKPYAGFQALNVQGGIHFINLRFTNQKSESHYLFGRAY